MRPDLGAVDPRTAMGDYGGGGGGGGKYPQRTFWWFPWVTVTAGNALLIASATNFYSPRAYQNPGADGDTWTYSFMLAAGEYTLWITGESANNRGIVDIYIDDVLQDSQDWYTGGTVSQQIITSSITVVGDGRHVLKGVMNGKNASSSGYYLVLTVLRIYPATDTTDVE